MSGGPAAALAVADHNVPTTDRSQGIDDEESRIQVDTLAENCERHGIALFGMDDPRQGIVHIVGPEQGFTQPGMTIVCGDSHTATHGAFGALSHSASALPRWSMFSPRRRWSRGVRATCASRSRACRAPE